MGTFGSVGGEKDAGEFARLKGLDNVELKRQVFKDWTMWETKAQTTWPATFPGKRSEGVLEGWLDKRIV